MKENIFWCSNCINMSTRPRISFNKNGICNACEWAEEKKKLNWTTRLNQLEGIIKKNKNLKSYDCIVPVSGGKDGAYVANKLKEKYNLNVLTVTSRPPLETEIGKKNLSNFIDSGFDHVHVTPNQKAMKQLNKLGFIEKGSPYYGWLVSIFSVVIKVALQNNVNLIFYSEDGEIEYGGSTQNKNKALFDVFYMIENYFEGDYERIINKSKLSRNELYWFEITEEEKSKIKKSELSLTHWSYFEPWDSYRNYLSAKKSYIFLENENNSDGTFTNFAQNDQTLFMLHTYLMYLKFGFGRATQDAGIEIRRGAMNRSQAKNLAKLYDNNYPEKNIKLYLDYFEMNHEEFNNVIDKFANKKLFKKISGRWTPQFEIK